LTATLTVSFQGARAVTGPLINGQRIMWRIMNELAWRNERMTIPIDLAVPPGRTVADVLAALRALVERHEALRTQFGTGPDGRPQQRVLDRGELVVRRFAAGADAPASQSSFATATAPNRATGFSAALSEVPIGPADLPVRAGVVCDGETPQLVSLAVSHMAVDGWSRGILIEDLTALLAGAELPPVAEQPVDRAAYEASPEGLLVQRRALEHWRTALRRLPEPYFAAAGDFARHADSATITSPAAAHALGRLAARIGVGRSTCMAAAVSLAIGLRQQEPCGALWLIVATRFRTPSARLVAAFNQNALLLPDWSADTHGSFTRGVARRLLAAYRASQYEDEAQLALLAELAAGHGGNPPRSWYYNDISPLLAAGGAAGEEPQGDLAALRGRTAIERTHRHLGQAGHQMYCNVRSTAEPAMVVDVTVDRRAVPDGGAARLLFDVETVLVTAAEGDLPLDQLRKQLDEPLLETW
jgi:hypothetical protein